MPKLTRIQRRAVKTRFSQRSSARVARRMILGLYVPARPAIVEIGCGPAAALFEAVEMLEPSLAIGLDVDEKMLAAASETAQFRQITGMKLVTGRAESLPIAPRTIDLAIGFEVLHHVGDWRKAVDEVARVLKPGGHFLSREALNPTRAPWLGRLIHRIPRDLTWPEFVEHCESSGFTLVEAHRSAIHEECIFMRDAA